MSDLALQMIFVSLYCCAPFVAIFLLNRLMRRLDEGIEIQIAKLHEDYGEMREEYKEARQAWIDLWTQIRARWFRS